MKNTVQWINKDCIHYEHTFPYGQARCNYNDTFFQADQLISGKGYLNLKPSCKDCKINKQ